MQVDRMQKVYQSARSSRQQTPSIGIVTLCVRDGQLVKQFGAN